VSVVVRFASSSDVSRLIDGMIAAAEVARAKDCPLLARAYVALANDLGDALDASRAGGPPRGPLAATVSV
jgi:hypothetical protein